MQLLQINFDAKDQPDLAIQTLRQTLLGIGDTPIIGLLVKVEENPETGQDQIVNWRMADAQMVKLLALTMPFEKNQGGLSELPLASELGNDKAKENQLPVKRKPNSTKTTQTSRSRKTQ
jgi:hypothetical protein